jgi:glycosyltransferase involved in cell wall biosynthesis
MSRTPGPNSILHVLVSVAPTNGQYHEHCLPLAHQRRITICALRTSTVTPPPEITLLQGDGTVRGCLRILRCALERGPYEVVHAHAPASGAALLAANLSRRRSMAHCVFTMQNSFRNYPLRNRLLLVPIFAAFPAIVLCSEAVRESLPSVLRRLGGSRITVVPNAVDLARIDRTLDGAAQQRGRDGFTVASVGRLIDVKNPFTLLYAFRLGCAGGGVDGCRLVVVGNGPLRPRLEAEAAALRHPGEVIFTGQVGRDDVYRHVARADLCVSTSYGEGMPVAVLEAMACGRPVVLSDIPPHREIAAGADFVPLVPPDDVDGFAEHIRRFRAMAPEERAEIGKECRRLVEDRYGIPAMHALLNEVYRRVTAKTVKEGSS